jgi:hypothetical protein
MRKKQKEILTSSVSAALFKSTMPPGAPFSKFRNFFVNSPRELSYRQPPTGVTGLPGELAHKGVWGQDFWPFAAFDLAKAFEPFPESGVGTGLPAGLVYPGLIIQSFDSAASFSSLSCFRFNYKQNIVVRL